jgi:hypothetical protein
MPRARANAKTGTRGRVPRGLPPRSGKGTAALLALLAALVLLAASHRVRAAGPEAVPPPRADEPALRPCAREEAVRRAGAASADGSSLLRAAGCFALLAERGNTRAERLADARLGREMAEASLRRFPRSGLAHYLASWLAGLEAENGSRRRAWRLVRVIESEALLAAGLDPSVDHGGPDRILGELYLRAPGSPLGPGDQSKSIRHYRRAVAADPGYPGNRIGLAEALLAVGDRDGACAELSAAFANDGEGPYRAGRRKAREMHERHCAGGAGERR